MTSCKHCGRLPCGCVVVEDGTRYVPARRVRGEVFDAGGYPQGCTREPHEGHDHRSELPAIGSASVDLGVTIVDADGQPLPPDPDAFPWDEPSFGLDVSALVGAPVAPSAEDLAASLSKAAGEPIEVRDVRIEGGALHCNVTMSRDLAEDLGLAPMSGVEVVRDALLSRLRDEPEGGAS